MKKNKNTELNTAPKTNGLSTDSKTIAKKAKKEKLSKEVTAETIKNNEEVEVVNPVSTDNENIPQKKKDKKKEKNDEKSNSINETDLNKNKSKKKHNKRKIETPSEQAQSENLNENQKHEESHAGVEAPAENQQNGKKKKSKKNKTSAAKDTTKKELTQKDLAKIEKKKAKKLAQKLKKKLAKQSKNEDAKQEPETKVNDAAVDKVDEKKKKKKKKDKKNAQENNDKVYEPTDPAATIFVGNLPVNTKRVQLIRLFHKYTPIKSIRFRTAGGKKIFKHKARKQSNALLAFMVLKNAAVAEEALAMNGCEFKGNHLRVTRSTKYTENLSDIDAKRMVFVGNLKYSANEEKLREIFSSCGEIDYVRCLQGGEHGCNGVAYVCFKAPESVGLALELNETILDDRPIHVERYSIKKLGAKKARDEAVAAENKKSSKSTKSPKSKKQKQPNNSPGTKEENNEKKKKNEFRGVKVDKIKKIKNKKKPNNQMKTLAKKIAPKSLLTTGN